MLDKGRATVAGKAGEYHYDCPMDQRFLEFVGIDAAALKEQLAAGKGDGEILAWVETNAKHKHHPASIVSWSALAEQRAPGDLESSEFFNGLQKTAAPNREDVSTWFDLLDVDDFFTFGGTP